MEQSVGSVNIHADLFNCYVTVQLGKYEIIYILENNYSILFNNIHSYFFHFILESALQEPVIIPKTTYY